MANAILLKALIGYPGSRVTDVVVLGKTISVSNEALKEATVEDNRPVAPWPDFAGQKIRRGDQLVHPDGTEFTVVYWPGDPDPWRAVYDSGYISRLNLQIGDKGQAVLCG